MKTKMAKGMTNQLPQRWLKKLRTALPLVILLAAFVGPGNVVAVDDLVRSDSPPQPATAVLLEYQETAYGINNWAVAITPQSAPFKREPAAVSGKILRGVLNFFGGSSNALPFLWQRGAGKLFLDLNRNQDLTDDPAGAFSACRGPGNYQTFTNVHLSFNTPSGTCPALIDFNFWDYGSRPSCYAAVRSFWQGRVTLQGRDWQAGLVPNDLSSPGSFKNGWLVLRPWQERNKAFNTYNGSLNTVLLSRKLFVDCHAYQLTCIASSQSGEVKPELQFTEQTVALGQLKITGKFIQRLILSGGPYLVMLDHPAEAVEVPTGRYNPPDILLEQGGVRAFCNSSQGRLGKSIFVSGQTPAVLAAGGPLTNSVTATRHGQDLLLNYQLIGAGGQTYQLANRDYARPPEFAIYKDGRKIASGKFQYG